MVKSGVFIVLFLSLVVGAAVHAADDPTIICSITDAEGRIGKNVTNRVLIATDTELQGWSFGVRWDPAEVSKVSAQRGALLETINNGVPADFIAIEEEPANGPGLTQGVVISFLQLAFLAPGTDYELQSITFLLVGEPGATEVVFTDDLGEPPVAVTGVVGGASITPTQNSGTITKLPPPDDCGVEPDTFLCESDPDNVFLTWTWTYPSCDTPRPFEFLYLYREIVGSDQAPELLGLWAGDGIEELPTSYDDLDLEPQTYRYTLAWVYWPVSGDPITLDFVQCEATVIALMITSVTPDRAFLPGTMWDVGHVMQPVEITITGRGFTTVEDTEVTIGDLPVTITEVTGDSEIRGIVSCSSELGVFDLNFHNSRGDIVIEDSFTYGWMRGDVRIDGEINLQDVLDLLNFLFKIPGWTPLECQKAADLNDDGYLDIADPIFLTYLIAGIDPFLYKPAEPYDYPLINDPTPDPLTCGLENYDCENP